MCFEPTVSYLFFQGGSVMRLTVGELEQSNSLSSLIDEFIFLKQTQGKSERTLKDYRKELKKFYDASSKEIDAKKLKQDCILYFSSLPSSSAAVFNRPFSCLNSFFNYCVRQEVLDYNPLTKAEIKKKIDDSTINAATIDDIRLLLNGCDKRSFTGLRLHTMISIMIDTGIRTSEIVRLEDRDFDEKGSRIIIRPEVCKTKHSRVLYLSPSTTLAIGKLIRMKPTGFSDKIFPSRDGNEMDTNNLSREFRKLSEKVDVKITPYQLRHSFATSCVANGINVFLLQQLMGHSDIAMTRRYTDINQEQLEMAHKDFSPLALVERRKRL